MAKQPKETETTTIENKDIFDFDLGDAEDLKPEASGEGEPEGEPEEPKEKPKRGRPPKNKTEEKDKDKEIEDEDEPEEKVKPLTDAEIEAAIGDGEGEEEDKIKKSEDQEGEDTLVTPFFDVMTERFGWDEFPENEKPKTMEEFFGIVEDVIKLNSKPAYHSETVEQFDEYMKAGGDPAKFIEVNYTAPDYEAMDIEKDTVQKRIIRDYYTMTGMKDTKIDSMIKRLEEDNGLEDEAKELQPELVTYDKERKKAITEEAATMEQSRKERAKSQVTSIGNQIMKMDDVYGIPISQKDKKELLPYMYLMGKDGKTQLQREIAENPEEYYVATTLLFKNRKMLADSITQKANKSAIEKLREKQKELTNKSRTSSDRSPAEEDGEDWLDSWYKQFTKKSN